MNAIVITQSESFLIYFFQFFYQQASHANKIKVGIARNKSHTHNLKLKILEIMLRIMNALFIPIKPEKWLRSDCEMQLREHSVNSHKPRQKCFFVAGCYSLN